MVITLDLTSALQERAIALARLPQQRYPRYIINGDVWIEAAYCQDTAQQAARGIRRQLPLHAASMQQTTSNKKERKVPDIASNIRPLVVNELPEHVQESIKHGKIRKSQIL